MRSTKIVATLGPSSSEPAVLERMVRAGVDVVRLNFSHGTADDHERRAALIKEIASKVGRTVGIMCDLQGPKIRVGKFREGRVMLEKAGTIVWNGPVGVFENEAFAKGTETLARAIAKSKAYTIAGGGDTVAAINKFGIAAEIDYISTAGGAFLEFLEGKTLPAVTALEARADG